MRFLIVNDDGIDAPGIRTLAEAAAQRGEVWVVAPEGQCSAMSQKITLGQDLLVCPRTFPGAAQAYSISGSPADCVRVGLRYLMEERPDYVLSGINYGWNMAYDIAYSGTVGAALEGVMNGVPSIAVSNQQDGSGETVDRYLLEILDEIFCRPQIAGEVWNVNFPGCPLEACPGILWDRTIAHTPYYEDTFRSVREEGNQTALSTHGTASDPSAMKPGTDAAAVLAGYVSVGMVRSMVM